MKLTAKGLRGTTVRKQLDDYAKAKGLTPKQKGDLTKKFLANINKRHPDEDCFKDFLMGGINSCFVWIKTPEGWDFWNEVDGVYIK